VTYLADTSAVWRLLRGQEAPQWRATLKAGLIALCPVVESEVLQAVQSTADGMRVSTLLNSLFSWVPCPDDPWQQVIGVQHDLIKIGHNRGPGAIDILVALTAVQHRLTVLHLDNDFAAIAKVRPDIQIQQLE
jgi:predicted nucleic acid-binding protein